MESSLHAAEKPIVQLLLMRHYHTLAVNGELYIGNTLIAHTIELPWLQNKVQRSCIPEGKYRIIKRWSPRFKWHLHVLNVPGRSLILLHPANDAIKELKGCIAPVSTLTGIGKGSDSRLAMQNLMSAIDEAGISKTIFITIKSESS
jgi:hypothetical protein